MIPAKQAKDLSPATRDRYLKAVRNEETSIRFKADDPITKAAAVEIAEAGLGILRLSKEFHSSLHLVRPLKEFSVARDDDARNHPGFLYAEVEVLRSANEQRDGHLLACLFGAQFQNKTSQMAPWQTWTLDVRHAKATDSDHDSCILARIEIEHPVMNSHDGFSTTFIANLTDIRMWPTGTDITMLNSNTGKTMKQAEVCDYGSCAKDPHPYGPYLPKDRDDLNAYLGLPVRITTTPLALVQDNGLHLTQSLISDDED